MPPKQALHVIAIFAFGVVVAIGWLAFSRLPTMVSDHTVNAFLDAVVWTIILYNGWDAWQSFGRHRHRLSEHNRAMRALGVVERQLIAELYRLECERKRLSESADELERQNAEVRHARRHFNARVLEYEALSDELKRLIAAQADEPD